MENKLAVVEQKEVNFYDDDLIAVLAEDGRVYVSFRHLCDALGLNRSTQVRKVRDHEILNEGYKGGVIMTPPSKDGKGGGRQQAGLFRADLVPMWLTTVSVSRVKPEIQDKIKQYQREAAIVLWEAFQSGRLTTTPSFEELIQKDSPAVNAYKTALAIVELAKNQVLLEGRLDEHEQRLEMIEATLGDTQRNVTPDQASQISQAVKAVAIAQSKINNRNEFGAVYGEMYRKFGITSYKLLPERRFKECMDWLTDWHSSLTSDTF